MSLPFVGRDHEIGRLLSALSEAERGTPRILFIAGEPGAGKSTLTEAFTARAQAANSEVLVAIGMCDAHTGLGDPYLPFLEVVQQFAGLVEATKQRTTSEQNGSRLKRIAGVSTDLLVEYAPDLIGSIIPGSSFIVTMARKAAESAGLIDRLKGRFDAAEAGTVAVDQQRIMESYTSLLRELSKRAPLIIILDDLHWVDAASCALLFHLMQNLKDARVLFVGTYRPSEVRIGRGSERHPLASVLNELKRYHGDIVLDMDATGEAQRRAFVSGVIDSLPNELDRSFRDALFHKTGGHALFTVELLRTLQERGDLAPNASGKWAATRAINWSVLPSRVEGVIQERIERLQDEVRELLRVASVEGESFTVEILSRVGEITERQLLKTLSEELQKRHQLVTEGEVEKVGRQWISHYNFAHSLFQQYLYEQLGRRERMMLHGSIAEILEQLYEGQLDLIAVQLARHYRVAGDAKKAYEYSMQVARRAMRMGAVTEVLAHVDAALGVIEELPEAERIASELNVQMLRGHAYRILQGWNGPDVVTTFTRARELLLHMPADARTYAVYTNGVTMAMWTVHMMKLELKECEEEALDVLEMTEKLEMIASDILTDEDMQWLRDTRTFAYEGLSATYLWMGRLPETLEYARLGFELTDPNATSRYILALGHDPRGVLYRSRILAEWVLGNRDRARAAREEMNAAFAKIGHPFTADMANYAGYLPAFLLRDVDLTDQEARNAIAACAETTAPYYRVLPHMFVAWVEAVRGDVESIAKIEQLFRAINVNGGSMYHSTYKMLLADAHAVHKYWNQALAELDAGIEFSNAHQELVFIAEMHRRRGDVLRQLGRADEAKASYHLAIDLARQQGAGLFEEFARTSLRGFEAAVV